MNKEDLKLLGIPEDTPEDKFLETFNSTYIKRDDVLKDETLTGKIVGKRIGSINTLLLKYAEKDHSFAIGEDKKPKPIEELIPLIFEEQKNKIKEIEVKSNLTAEERVKQAEEKLKALEIERNQYKGELNKTAHELEQERINAAKSIDGVLIKYALADRKSKIKVIDAVKTTQLEDLDRALDAKYLFDFEDETKKTVIPKTKDGQLIQSKKGTGFAGIDEILELEYDERGMLKKNNAQPINTRIDQNNPAPQNGRQIRDLSGINKGG